MLRHDRDHEGDGLRPSTLEVFDLRVFDEAPATHAPPAPPRACRWHLWHRWTPVRVDARTTYVACTGCGRLPAPTIFERPVP